MPAQQREDYFSIIDGLQRRVTELEAARTYPPQDSLPSSPRTGELVAYSPPAYGGDIDFELYDGTQWNRVGQVGSDWELIMSGTGRGTTWGAVVFAYSPVDGWVSPGAAAAANAGVMILPYDPAVYDVPGKATKIRVRGVFTCNSTAPGVNFAVGVYSVSGFTGGSGVMSFSMSALNTTTITTPAANTPTPFTSTEADAPASLTNICIGTVPTGTATAGHDGGLSIFVEIRHE